MSDFTLAQYNALMKAYAAGALRVTVEGRSTEYRSLKEMNQIINMMRGQLINDGLLPPPPTNPLSPFFRVPWTSDKGLSP